MDSFLSQNSGKKVVVIQGLGFVGAVMSLVCANAMTEEYAVIGVDLANENTYWKVKSINDGVFPLIADDPKIAKFFNWEYIDTVTYASRKCKQLPEILKKFDERENKWLKK